jgi:tetratricopeptide (TPR) repeat protein
MPTIKKRSNAESKQQEQQIVTLAHRANDLIANYRKPFTLAVATVVILAVLWGGYSFFRSQQEQKASPLVAAAYEFYRPSLGAPPDYGKAIELFRKAHAAYSGTQNGAIALYYEANCLADSGKSEDAVKTYQDFTREYGRDTFVLGLVYQRLGYVFMQLGKADESRKAFEQAEALLGPGAATVELAKQYEAAGNQIEAEKKYKTILDKLGGTSWAMDAFGRVQKIAPSSLPGSATQSK